MVSVAAVAAEVKPIMPKYGNIARRVVNMLPRFHVSRHPFDDAYSQRAWTNLVTLYDFDHSVFLKSDLDEFARREKRLDDELKAGDVSFGFDVYNRYVERLRERVDFATNLLATATWDFATNETYRIRRKDAPWPETREAAEEHWRKRMKNEVLVQLIAAELDRLGERQRSEMADAKQDLPTNKVDAAGNLIKKYRQYVLTMTEPDEEAVLQYYLGSVCRAYDPHTDYLSPATKEDFDMDMNLTLCGVGAVLSMEDGALKITEVMPGGPMDRDGRIKEGDKIVGVQQGGGEMEDILWQPMRKSIKKIRGKKGTRVTLEIVPRADAAGANRKRIELVRDEIKLEDQAATGRVETVVLGGVTNRLGYIDLPGFYETMDKRFDEEGYRSCAMDVSRYLADFNAKGVEGVALDLRGNGGGSLREAVLLSALFVPEGPVVQIRDLRSVGSLPIPPGNPVAFRKPVVVLTDRASASASEIVAGHLQDVGRAVIVGDGHTHGKGTVQTVMGLGPREYGSMKITTARFYRVNGRSTQVDGVQADIRLPSLLDSLDVGEDKLTYALPPSRILAADYAASWNLPESLAELRVRSAARLVGNEDFKHHVRAVEAMKVSCEREEAPLEYSARFEMMKQDRDVQAKDAETTDEEAVADEGESGEEKEEKVISRRRSRRSGKDPVLDETLRILADLVDIKAGEEVPQPKGWWE